MSIEERGEKAVPAPIKPSAKELMPRWAITTLGAVGGGTLLYLVGMPAGAILGGMAITVLLNVTWGRCAMPSKTRHVTQTLSGAYIGTTLTAEYVRTLPQLIFPVLIMLVGVFVWCFLVGFIIHKLTKLEFETCMLACAPGGVTGYVPIGRRAGPGDQQDRCDADRPDRGLHRPVPQPVIRGFHLVCISGMFFLIRF